MCGMITYGPFCSRYIESMRLGQLQWANCSVILRPPAWYETNVLLSLNDCEENVMRVRRYITCHCSIAVSRSLTIGLHRRTVMRRNSPGKSDAVYSL